MITSTQIKDFLETVKFDFSIGIKSFKLTPKHIAKIVEHVIYVSSILNQVQRIKFHKELDDDIGSLRVYIDYEYFTKNGNLTVYYTDFLLGEK